MRKITQAMQQEAIAYLSVKDPVLKKIISAIEPPVWKFSGNYFISLVESVVSQQLSVKAADTIFGRLQQLSGDSELTAEAVLRLSADILRKAGLSWQKVSYIKNIADYTLTSGKVFEQFDRMNDAEIIAELTKIKGIGVWTAEMFLIFSMGRPDVFSYGDAGLRRAVKNLYGLTKEPDREKAERISAVWKPYRSIASRYLWKSLNNKV